MADRKRINNFFSLDFIKVRRLELQFFVKFSVYSKSSNRLLVLLVLYPLKNLVPMISGLSLPFTREESWERHCPKRPLNERTFQEMGAYFGDLAFYWGEILGFKTACLV